MSARTDCRGGGGEAGQPLGGSVPQFFLAGNCMAALHWQPAFFWREIIVVTSNGIKYRIKSRNP